MDDNQDENEHKPMWVSQRNAVIAKLQAPAILKRVCQSIDETKDQIMEKELPDIKNPYGKDIIIPEVVDPFDVNKIGESNIEIEKMELKKFKEQMQTMHLLVKYKKWKTKYNL